MQQNRGASAKGQYLMNHDPWIAYYKPRPDARLRLFCFPYAGGSASLYRFWSEILPGTIDVCPVQLPGREQRMWESPIAQLPSLLEQLVPALQPYLNLPFAFFGHSMGALIAYELARELDRQNHTGPVHLFVSGCRAPQITHPDTPVHLMSDAGIIEQLNSLNGTPALVLQSAEFMQLVLPLIRADFTLYETYLYERREPLPCPISAYGGQQDNQVSILELAAWQEQTRASFTLHRFPGDHFFLQHDPVPLLRIIARDLNAHDSV